MGCLCLTSAVAGAVSPSSWPRRSRTAQVRKSLSDMEDGKSINYLISTPLKVTALSNSDSQRLYIQEQARARGLNNLKVITGIDRVACK